MTKSINPSTMMGKVEKYLMTHKKIAVGDAEDNYDIHPDQLYRVIYDLKKLGYPITSEWVTNDLGEHYVIYRIPSKWSKKSLS